MGEAEEFLWLGGVQVYGHFALASALLPLLQAAPVARIVTQSSVRSTHLPLFRLHLDSQ